AREAVRPGAMPRDLKAIAMERMTSFGATISGHDGLFAALPRDPQVPLVRLTSDTPIAAGDHVALSVSVMFAGYEGNVGRTSICGDDATEVEALGRLDHLWQESWRSLRPLLQPGVSVADIQDHLSAGNAGTASFCKITGVGLGMEPPLLHSSGKAMPG